MPTLREWRIRKLWSQRELARRAGVVENTVISAERGRPVRLLTARRIADALGAPWEEIAEFCALVAGMEEKAAA